MLKKADSKILNTKDIGESSVDLDMAWLDKKIEHPITDQYVDYHIKRPKRK